MTRFIDSLSGVIYRTSESISPDDIAIINGLQNPPPVPVTPEDVFVRKCRLVGDGINCHFGRFHTEDLPELLQKTQGVSCLIGHRKETAGIARFFGGAIEKHKVRNVVTGEPEAMHFIVPKIYWMKSHSQAEDLRLNIDGGIYHQASISWYFEKPVCGLCDKDIRICEHVPGKMYDGKLCFFWYEQIGTVLEGSIVYSGGHPGTGFALNDAANVQTDTQEALFKLKSDGRLYKEDILPYLQNIESGNIYVIGDLANHGWTDRTIDILPEPDARDLVGELFPPYLADRVVIHTSLPRPGACIKVSNSSILEIESIPHPKTLEFRSKDDVPGRTNRNILQAGSLETSPEIPACTDAGDPGSIATGTENAGKVSVSIDYASDDEGLVANNKIYDVKQLECDGESFVITPHYDGIPVHITIGNKTVSTSSDLKVPIRHRVADVSIPVGFAPLESLFIGAIQKIVQDVALSAVGSCELKGELVGYRGRSRIDVYGLLTKENPTIEKARFVLKVFDFRDDKMSGVQSLPERLERFSFVFDDSEIVQRISYRIAGESGQLRRALPVMDTRDGVNVRPEAAPFGSPEKQKFLSKRSILDVVVLDVARKRNGIVYTAGIIDGERIAPIGATHVTSFECALGDIIRVEVGSIVFSESRLRWLNPRVIGVRIGAKADSVAVVHRLYRQLHGESSETFVQAAEYNEHHVLNGDHEELPPDFWLEEHTKDPEQRLVLCIRRNRNVETFSMRENDIEKLNGGYLCPGEWNTVNNEIHPNSDAQAVRDRGDMTIIEWGKYRRTGAFAGTELFGMYQFRCVHIHHQVKWFIVKKHQ